MICRKCNSPGSLFIRKEYCYCNDCFITYVVHKFRACIGKNKSLSPNERILICLSGGASSAVLLDLIYTSISLNNHKKLRVVPFCLHIIESDPDEYSISKSIEDQCKLYDFNLTLVNINDFYAKNLKYKSKSSSSTNQSLDFSKNILSKLPASISQDIVAKTKQNIFIQIAKELNCKIVFTAETTTLLASRLLSNIAIGRGSQVENDVGFSDSRGGNVKILRPMRDITTEEINQYISIKELKLAKPINSQHETSLQSLIKNFVLDLQENYPATISTVCKTADKIGSTDSNVEQGKCTLCQSRIESLNKNLTAMEATMFSKKVSIKLSEELNDIEDLHCNDDTNVIFPSIFESLCYCCSRNVSEFKNTNLQTVMNKNN